MTLLLALWACNGSDTPSTDTGDQPGNNADSGGSTDDTGDSTVEAELTTIHDLQSGAVEVDSWITVEDVTVTGVVDDYGLFVQEAGDPEHAGIWVYAGTGASAFAVGDAVDVTGWYEEYAGADAKEPWPDTLSEINVGEHAGTSSIAAGEAAATLEPVVLSAATFQDVELYEGVLATVEDITVTEGDLGFDEWGADQLVVSAIAYDSGPVYTGDTFASVTGVVHYGYGSYKLVPRSEADLVGRSSSVTPASALAAGEVVITELMIDPGAECDDTKDEYVELYNATAGTIDLEGLVFASGEKHTGAIESRVLMAPGAYAALVRENPSPCYGFEADAELNVPLVQDGAELSLSNEAGVIDAVDTTGWEIVTGASMESTSNSAAQNDSAEDWCVATTPLGSDFGTPGSVNLTDCD